MSQGLNKEYIFNQEKFKSNYLFQLKHHKEKYNISLVAYCIMDNHVHLLIYSDSVLEISKFMKIVNTKFAQYYNFENKRVGYVFRDRFLSEFIKDEKQLWTCIKYIHMNPVKAGICENEIDYKYSSYRDYLYSNGIISKKISNFIFKTSNYLSIFLNLDSSAYFFDIDLPYKTIKENKLNLEFKNYLKTNSVCKDDILNNPILLKNFCYEFIIKRKFNQSTIANLLEISRFKIHRILFYN